MATPRPSRWSWKTLASLGAAIPLFRPGTSLPAANAPYQGAPFPVPGRTGHGPRGRLRRSLRTSTMEGMFAELVTACTGGAVLTGWALHLGCSPLVIGLLSALPFLAQVLQIPSALLGARFGPRRVCIAAVGLSRQALLPLALLPWAPLSVDGKQGLLIGVGVVSALLGVIGNNAWVSWMGALVPRPIRGRYFGKRTGLCTLAGTVAALGAGVLLDFSAGWKSHALALLALVACIAGLVTTWLMIQKQDVPPERAPSAPVTVANLWSPLRDAQARRFLGYQVAWNAAIGLAGGFFALHMLQNLKMGFALIALHGAVVAATRMVASPLWGQIVDRVGARPVLVFCSFGISAIPLYWTWPTEHFLWPLALDVAVSGLLWSGHALAAFHLPLAIAPNGTRGFYYAAFATAGGLSYALFTLFGGALLEALPTHFLAFGHSWQGVHVLFVLSSLGRLASAIISIRLIEPNAGTVLEMARLLRSRVEPRAARARSAR